MRRAALLIALAATAACDYYDDPASGAGGPALSYSWDSWGWDLTGDGQHEPALLATVFEDDVVCGTDGFPGTDLLLHATWKQDDGTWFEYALDLYPPVDAPYATLEVRHAESEQGPGEGALIFYGLSSVAEMVEGTVDDARTFDYTIELQDDDASTWREVRGTVTQKAVFADECGP